MVGVGCGVVVEGERMMGEMRWMVVGLLCVTSHPSLKNRYSGFSPLLISDLAPLLCNKIPQPQPKSTTRNQTNL